MGEKMDGSNNNNDNVISLDTAKMIELLGKRAAKPKQPSKKS